MHGKRSAPGLAVVVIVAAACGTSGAPPAVPSDVVQPAATVASSTPARTATPEPTERPAGSYAACDGDPGAITLTVRDQEPQDGIGPAIDQLNGKFETANPAVRIVRQLESRDDLVRTILDELARPDGPDVTQLGPGREGIGRAVEAGLLLPLAGAETRYGWDGRWAPRTLDRIRFADDGGAIGAGTLYGVPVTGELVGLMLSDEVAHRRAIREAPQTLAEDLEDYAAVKEAGIVPILVGAADGDMLLVYGSILGSLVSPEWLDDFVYRRNGASFDTPEAVEAARLLVGMGDRGFFARGTASMGREEALRRFIDLEAQFLATGSWAWPDLKAAESPFMLTVWNPATIAGGALTPGGTGLPWAVRKTSAHPDCAAAYLDFITSDHAMELVAALEVALPSHVSAGALGSDPWFKDMAFAYRDAESANRLGHHLAWAFPAAGEAFTDGLAKLLAKELTPERFVRAIDEAYRASLATRP